MIIDHRTYTLHPGKMKEYVDRYERIGLPLQSKYLGSPLGWYISMDVGMLNQVVHLWAYRDLNDQVAVRAKVAQDPKWQTFLVKATPLLVEMRSIVLTPAPASPMK